MGKTKSKNKKVRAQFHSLCVADRCFREVLVTLSRLIAVQGAAVRARVGGRFCALKKTDYPPAEEAQHPNQLSIAEPADTTALTPAILELFAKCEKQISGNFSLARLLKLEHAVGMGVAEDKTPPERILLVAQKMEKRGYQF